MAAAEAKERAQEAETQVLLKAIQDRPAQGLILLWPEHQETARRTATIRRAAAVDLAGPVVVLAVMAETEWPTQRRQEGRRLGPELPEDSAPVEAEPGA